jgi:four helix bundle protein
MTGPKVRSYRDLQVWQRSKALAVEVYRITAAFPQRDQYGLADQMRRAAVSIPSNIAEGHIRRSSRVFARHIDIALGSAAELSTQIEIARDVGYITEQTHQTLQHELEEIVIESRSFKVTPSIVPHPSLNPLPSPGLRPEEGRGSWGILRRPLAAAKSLFFIPLSPERSDGERGQGGEGQKVLRTGNVRKLQPLLL